MNRIVYNPFSCYVEDTTFKNHYAVISEDERGRLDRVAWRMWLTLQLRYRAKFSPNFALRGEDSLNLAYVELPSVEVYLLATCLDTLAGEPKWPSFDRWLQKFPAVCGLNTEGIIDLFELWREDHGPRRTVRKLFEGVPPCVAVWLSENVVFQKYSEEKPVTTKLFGYFYDDRRNEFTHSSVTRHTVMAIGEVEFPSEDEKGWSSCTDGVVRYRKGLDLATILRIIIYVVVLQKLRISVTLGHVEAYLKTLSELDALYCFKWEIVANREELDRWAAYREAEVNMILRPLRFVQAQRLAQKLKTSPVAMERELSRTIDLYLQILKQLNSAIADFEANHPREPFEIPDSYRQALLVFFSCQMDTDSYRFASSSVFSQSSVMSIDLFLRERGG